MQEPPEAVRKLIKVIDTVGEWSGKVFAWMVVPLIVALTYEVIMRYGFDAPTTWAYDVSYMVYGGHFMLGAGYTLLKKGHIRTDFFYEAWPARRQGWIDAVSYLVFFFPGLVFFMLAGWDAAWHSWQMREASEVSAWRPPLYPFKFVMPVTAALLLLQGVSEFTKSVWAARTGRWL
ncbi:MAG TPA: transporter [Candidatus Rokubacteria bacterium]|nr:transporter [Candidatus Rokubacteria bacterium]